MVLSMAREFEDQDGCPDNTFCIGLSVEHKTLGRNHVGHLCLHLLDGGLMGRVLQEIC